PFADYQALVNGKVKVEPGIPAVVVDLAMDNEWSAARAWREHKELTQAEVAQRMGITQGAYAQLEGKKTIRKSSREKIAKALCIHESQLDF
ncbi:MAG: helix-turn-helix domain-containing protein, partial [Betaproteobacteria bacterium]|nr:helix-turn-helix domain-containing protein [Betaproteobacteria bacterium]